MAKGHFLYKFNYLLAKNIIVYVNIQIELGLNINMVEKRVVFFGSKKIYSLPFSKGGLEGILI